jgi:hypothetical protein
LLYFLTNLPSIGKLHLAFPQPNQIFSVSPV